MNIYSKKSMEKAPDNEDLNSEEAGFMLGYLE